MNINAQNWVKELRSGKWNQGMKKLCVIKKVDNNTFNCEYCCLGIACEIYYDNLSSIVPFTNVDLCKRYSDDENYLPTEVVEYLELRTKCGGFVDDNNEDCLITIDGKIFFSLAEINDAGYSFDKIADIIEEYQDLLFVPETN